MDVETRKKIQFLLGASEAMVHLKVASQSVEDSYNHLIMALEYLSGDEKLSQDEKLKTLNSFTCILEEIATIRQLVGFKIHEVTP